MDLCNVIEDGEEAQIAAQERMWEIINTYASPVYFLKDPYSTKMTDEQYQVLYNVAVEVTKDCDSQYEKIRALVGFVANEIYYDPKVSYKNPYDVYIEKRTNGSGYLTLLKNIEDQTVFEKGEDKIWVCRNCGHVYVGTKALELCPVCKHPKSHMEVKADNYK